MRTTTAILALAMLSLAACGGSDFDPRREGAAGKADDKTGTRFGYKCCYTFPRFNRSCDLSFGEVDGSPVGSKRTAAIEHCSEGDMFNAVIDQAGQVTEFRRLYQCCRRGSQWEISCDADYQDLPSGRVTGHSGGFAASLAEAQKRCSAHDIYDAVMDDHGTVTELNKPEESGDRKCCHASPDESSESTCSRGFDDVIGRKFEADSPEDAREHCGAFADQYNAVITKDDDEIDTFRHLFVCCTPDECELDLFRIHYPFVASEDVEALDHCRAEEHTDAAIRDDGIVLWSARN